MTEPRILVLGGYGETGRRLADLLLSRTKSRVLVRGRDAEKAKTLAEELNRRHPDERADGEALDARDGAALRRALGGVDLLVNATTAAAPIAQVAEAAIDVGVDVVDVQFAPRQWGALDRLAPRIEATGLCVVVQAGFHPGVPAALVRWAASRMDALESAWVAGLLRPQGGIPYTPAVDDLIDSFRGYEAARASRRSVGAHPALEPGGVSQGSLRLRIRVAADEPDGPGRDAPSAAARAHPAPGRLLRGRLRPCHRLDRHVADHGRAADLRGSGREADGKAPVLVDD